MKWLSICGAVLVLFFVLALWLTRRGTIYMVGESGYAATSNFESKPHRANPDELTRRGTTYVFGKSGYTATSNFESKPHRANPDQLHTVISRLLPGDRFDMLWISWTDDRYSGIMVTLDTGSPKLTVSFKTHSEQAKLKSCKKAMDSLGHPFDEESNGFNGGMEEQYRVTNLEYKLPSSEDAIIKAVNVALTNLHGTAPSAYFVEGSLFAHGPGSGSGIKFQPEEDPLLGLLGPP